MRKHYALIATSACFTGVHLCAQTVDQGNIAPLPGESYAMRTGAYLPPGPGGLDQVWDYTALAEEYDYPENYVEPASTGYDASFPDAVVVQDIDNGFFLGFHEIDVEGMDFAGYVFPSPFTEVVFDQAERLVPFPCEFGTSWNGPLSATYDFNGNTIVLTGSYIGTADATGALLMPYGPVEHVLRVRLEEQYSLSISGGSVFAEHIVVNHLFLRPDVHRPVLMVVDEMIIEGTDTTHEQSCDWIAELTLGAAHLPVEAAGFALFPNPSSGEVTMVYGSSGDALRIELFDAAGQRVRSQDMNAVAGIQRHTINVHHLPPGLYQVRLTRTNGQQGSERLVVR